MLRQSYMLDASAQWVHGAMEVVQWQGVSEAGWEHVPHMQVGVGLRSQG